MVSRQSSTADACLISELYSSVIRAETVNLFLKEVITVIYTDALLVSLKTDVSVLDSCSSSGVCRWDETDLLPWRWIFQPKTFFLSPFFRVSSEFLEVVYSPVKRSSGFFPFQSDVMHFVWVETSFSLFYLTMLLNLLSEQIENLKTVHKIQMTN